MARPRPAGHALGMPETRLRSIALHVEEPRPRAFVWVLSEARADGPWQPLQRATAPAPRYHEAVAQGLLALQALVDDLDSGPREALPRQRKPPARGVDRDAGAQRYFGFGPAG